LFKRISIPPAATLAATCLALASIASPTATAAPTAADPHAEVRGMTVSCHGAGLIWGSDAMVETMRELKQLGVNWITIHPYAGIGVDGRVGGGGMERMYADPSWLTRPIDEAHKLGLKIMIKPHLAYWGSPFGWRGEIQFDSEQEWTRFFDDYERWVVTLARLTRDADGFVIGTELEQTAHHDARWRAIIASVREQTDAPLTYSAGWDRYERVGFWDALDVIGIQGYFPLVDHERPPTDGELRQGWNSVMQRLDAFAEGYGKKVIFGELGYNRSALAAVRPWEYAQGGEQADEIQQRCLRVALESIAASETVVGAFLWKWFPGQSRWRGNFLKSTPAMRAVIGEAWRQPAPH